VTNIHVDFFGIEPQQLPTFMAAGQWPDFFHSNLNKSYINDHGILGGQLVDFNQVLQYMPNLQRAFADYPFSKKSVTEMNGAMYQIPDIENTATSTLARFYVRTDNLKKNGLAMPQTIDQLYDALVALKKATGNPHLLDTIGSLELFLYPSFGDSLEVDFDAGAQNRVVFNRTSEQYKRFLSFLRKCYVDGLLHRAFLTLDETTKLQMGKQGLFSFGGGGGGGGGIANLSLEDFPSGEFDIGQPKPFASQWNRSPKVKGVYYRAPGNAISAKSKYIPEIARMLDIAFALEEVSPGSGLSGNAFMYGPEGYAWRFTGPDKKEMDFWIPDGYPGITNFSVLQWDWLMYQHYGARFEQNMAITIQKTNNRARQIGFRDILIPNSVFEYFPGNSVPANFLRYTVEEQAVVDSKYTDISSYVNEMRAKFITGVSDIDREWASYVQTINSMGIADVLRVYQAAYDRWNKM
jgi:putative aldouronate transport system substrate-binding protein